MTYALKSPATVSQPPADQSADQPTGLWFALDTSSLQYLAPATIASMLIDLSIVLDEEPSPALLDATRRILFYLVGLVGMTETARMLASRGVDITDLPAPE